MHICLPYVLTKYTIHRALHSDSFLKSCTVLNIPLICYRFILDILLADTRNILIFILYDPRPGSPLAPAACSPPGCPAAAVLTPGARRAPRWSHPSLWPTAVLPRRGPHGRVVSGRLRARAHAYTPSRGSRSGRDPSAPGPATVTDSVRPRSVETIPAVVTLTVPPGHQGLSSRVNRTGLWPEVGEMTPLAIGLRGPRPDDSRRNRSGSVPGSDEMTPPANRERCRYPGDSRRFCPATCRRAVS